MAVAPEMGSRMNSSVQKSLSLSKQKPLLSNQNPLLSKQNLLQSKQNLLQSKQKSRSVHNPRWGGPPGPRLTPWSACLGFAKILLTLIILPIFGATAAQANTWYVTIAGLGGEPEYEVRFAGWAADLDKSLRAIPGAQVNTYSGKQATKGTLRKAFTEFATKVKPEDNFAVILIGHGTFDGNEYKLNIPGPDISATELASWLDKIPATRQLVVNTTSAAGASVSALQKANRTIIAATRNGTEKNATLFARYFVEAFRDPGADTDKNETMSALEAFKYADQKTVKFYETQKRLATEHAVLEDTGKGEAVRAPSAENGKGLTAARFPLMALGNAQKFSAEKQKLVEQKQDLEGQIDKLKYEKAATPADEYRRKLAQLLVQLAKIQEELEK